MKKKEFPWDLSSIRSLSLFVSDCQLQESYDAINPAHLLPTLQLPNGTRLFQSPAILEFLEESYPSVSPLLPEKPLDRAQVRALMSMIVCDIHPVQNLRVLQRVGPEGKADWARHFITLGFDALEKALSKTAGKYCFKGENVNYVNIHDPLTSRISYRQYNFGGPMSCAPSLQCPPVRLFL